MNSDIDQNRARIRAAIETVVGAQARENENGRQWMFPIQNAAAIEIAADLVAEWLLLRAPAVDGRIHGQATPVCSWELAQRNALLAGPAKIVLTPGAMCVSWGVDISLDEELDLPKQLADGCGSLGGAVESLRVRRPRAGSVPHRPVVADTREKHEPAAMADLATAAGWYFSPRKGGSISVPLATAPVSYTALVERRDGSIIASLTVQLDENLPEVCRQAVGLLLLEAGGVLRMVRGSICKSGDGPSAALEVVLPESATAVEINHALCALSIAGRECAAELLVMCDPQIAQMYLHRQGWSLPNGRKNVDHTKTERRILCAPQ